MSDDSEKDLDKGFSEEREGWTGKIRGLSVRMNNIREIADVQVELFSERQRLLEYTYQLGAILTKLNKKFRKDKSDRMRHYSEQTQIRYGANEKTPLIDGDLTEIKSRVEVVDNQISFLNETVKTIDHMLYGIRQRIILEEYIRGGSLRKE